MIVKIMSFKKIKAIRQAERRLADESTCKTERRNPETKNR